MDLTKERIEAYRMNFLDQRERFRVLSNQAAGAAVFCDQLLADLEIQVPPETGAGLRLVVPEDEPIEAPPCQP